GAQNLNPAAQGAFTGDISAGMLLDLGCRYVLVGHSERRALFGESDKDVAMRFEAAHCSGLEPVLCCFGDGVARQQLQQGGLLVASQRPLSSLLVSAAHAEQCSATGRLLSRL
ncbi:MAG: triose-phosphate isomerase, partial [Alteromonas sp.]